MDSLMFFWEMYKKASFWRIFVDTYRPGGRLNLWLTAWSILTVAMIVVLSFRERDLCSNIWILFVAMWVCLLRMGLRVAYPDYYAEYRDRLSFYNNGSQYLRYLIFRDEIMSQNARNRASISDAIQHIDADLDTEVTDNYKLGVYISLAISVFSVLLGVFLEKIQTPYVILIASGLVVVVSIGFAIIGSLRDKRARLMELKRYLIWLQGENIPTG